MLFDLRGRGRRRTVQVDLPEPRHPHGRRARAVRDRRRHQRRPHRRDPGQRRARRAGPTRSRSASTRSRSARRPTRATRRAWAQLAGLRFQLAGSGANYDQATQRLHRQGQGRACARRRPPGSATSALAGEKPDTTVANQMVQAYGVTGLQQLPGGGEGARVRHRRDAERRPSSSTPSSRCSRTAPSRRARRRCRPTRRSRSRRRRQRKTLRDQIKAAQQQLDTAAGSTTTRVSSAAGARGPGRRARSSAATIPDLARPCSSTGRAADS